MDHDSPRYLNNKIDESKASIRAGRALEKTRATTPATQNATGRNLVLNQR